MIGPVLISLGGNMEISTVTHAEVTTHNPHILIDTRHNSSHPHTLLYWTFHFDYKTTRNKNVTAASSSSQAAVE